MNYIIGLDAHSKYCEFSVYNKSNNLVECKRIDTTEEDLTDYVRRFKNPKIIIFEESAMAQWLYTIFLPYFDDVIVCDPRVNYLINKSENKNDQIDSKNLVKLYLNNSIQRVYHTDSDILKLKRLVIQYHSHIKDTTRKKNQIRAKYRENGITTNTKKLYSKRYYKDFIDQLKSSSSRFIIMSLMRSLYRSKMEADRIKKAMIMKSRRYEIIKEFIKIPGVGHVIAITFFAIVITPGRFGYKKKLWSYSGLGISTKESGGKVYSKKLNRRSNRLLKCAALQATRSNIMQGKGPFYRMYTKLLNQGITEKNARHTVARKIVSTMYYMWLKGFKFDAEYIN